MSHYKIATIIGSLRKDSFNRKLADAIVKLAPAEFSFKLIPIDDLPLYNQDDILVARDGIKKLTGLGIQFRDLTFWVELGKKIVEQEMDLRRKVVEGKSLRENVAITAELTRMGDYYRDYIMRRLFQRQVEYNIQKSLLAREKRKL